MAQFINDSQARSRVHFCQGLYSSNDLVTHVHCVSFKVHFYRWFLMWPLWLPASHSTHCLSWGRNFDSQTWNFDSHTRIFHCRSLQPGNFLIRWYWKTVLFEILPIHHKNKLNVLYHTCRSISNKTQFRTDLGYLGKCVNLQKKKLLFFKISIQLLLSY